MYLVRDAVELARKILNSRLNEHRVWQAAFCGLTGDLCRGFFEGPGVRVDTDKELVGIRFCRSRHKSTVACTDVEHNARFSIRRDHFRELFTR